jgi:pimeloyl-ACP methyl ester carboxylesterase
MNTLASTAGEPDRAFVRVREGLMHYRHSAPAPGTVATTSHPVWMMHASPASSRSLETLLMAMGSSRRAIAPDTPGNGDSAALTGSEPALGDYADAFLRTMDALGLERVDLYGYHTGAHIAIEMAILRPDRVGSVVLDGLLWLEDSERADYLAEYAPPLVPDAQGTQVFRALQFIRDQAWFFPHFRRDAAHNLGGGAMPPALLHTLTIDLLKAAGTYHLAYNAVFRHRLEERLPLLRQPVLLLADEGDPTRHSIPRAAALIKDARTAVPGEGWSPQGAAAKAALIGSFLG